MSKNMHEQQHTEQNILIHISNTHFNKNIFGIYFGKRTIQKLYAKYKIILLYN